MREFLEILLMKEGYQVTLAASGEEAVRVLENNTFGSHRHGYPHAGHGRNRCPEEGQSAEP